MQIEDSYPLSPVQQGMLFHSQYAPQSGVYVQQLICALHEELNIPAFMQAWERVVERHAVFRTSFRWEGLEGPLQEVHRRVKIPVEEQDWRGLPVRQQDERLRAYLEADRRRGFDLTEAPLLRLALFRLADDDYRLIRTCHHALLDGGSLLVVLKELFAFYEAFRFGQDLQLQHPRPYRDYIEWLGQQDFTKAESFWRRMLSGLTAPTPLIMDHGHRSQSEEERYGTQRIRLSERLTLDLKYLTQRHQLTLNTLVQGVWALLLSRYSGEENVVFGATRASRHSTLQGAESMVGLLINTLPVRVRVFPDGLLLPWLKELRSQWITMREFEHTPLSNIHGWSQIPPGKPLFESLVVFENGHLNSVLRREDSGWEKRDFRLLGTTNYPLTVTGYSEPKLLLEITYDQRCFEDAAVTRMLGHLQTLLEGIVANPDRRLSDLPLLTEAERHQLLVEWNDTSKDYPQDKCINQLFEEQVERVPDAVAVVFEDQRLTYRDLNRRANQLAHYLQTLGVGPELRVGICIERSLEMVVGILGILKAGGAYVPLDPEYPKDRLAFMLDDSKAKVLLTQGNLLARLFEHKARVVCLDTDWEDIARESEENPAGEVRAGNLAYLIYTSGSTGTPKGVAIEHRSTGALLHWARGVFAPEDLAGVLASTSICFDLSVFELFVPLSCGGKIILAENALQLPTLSAATEVTLINTVPSAITELLKADRVPASVRTVNLAGEPLQTSLVEQLYRKGTIQKVFDLYGPSEDTTYSTFALRSSQGPATIGRPIANTQVYLLDTHLNPVPIRVPGELYIGGDGLARGYLDRPELTAEKFIPNPFSDEPGARLYKTGDVARFLPDGNIEFLGRIDHQVKIRGFRIELGEIEAVLGQHPAVEQAVVLAREYEQTGPSTSLGTGKRLVAYVISKQEPSPTVSELRSFLKEKLPDYMVPAAFVFLNTLPLTPNGKVDRKALPEPDQSRPELEQTFVAPRTDTEEALAGIWAEVLGLDQVGIHDNFFDLGGHSLLAVQIISRIQSLFNVELPLRCLFEAPSVAGLAAAIESSRMAGLPSSPITSIRRDRGLPLSYTQERFWFLHQFNPETDIYNLPYTFRIQGLLNMEALRQSLQEMVTRHEVLRTSFDLVDGQPQQIIASKQTLDTPVIDLSDVPETERERKTWQLVEEEARRPFDLGRGPLFRTVLFRLGDRDHVLHLNLHHIVCDAWSMGVLLHEISVMYDAIRAGRPSPLLPLRLQYVDFAVWQRERVKGELLEAQIAYWKRKLSNSPPALQLPTDRPRPPVQTFRGGSKTCTFFGPLSEKLWALCRQEASSLFMIFLTALQILLHRHTGETDIVVGAPVAGRDRVEFEGVVGCFLNSLVLRTDLSGNATFRELLRRAREFVFEAYANQDVPFEKLLEELQPVRDPSRTPLFQVLLNMHNFPDGKLPLSGLSVTRLASPWIKSLFDMTLYFQEHETEITLKLVYNADLFEGPRMNELLDQFQYLLEQVVENPEMPLQQFSLATPKACSFLPDPTSPLDVKWGGSVHRQFSQQAQWVKERLAVSDKQNAWTYNDLESRSNQLANYLLASGIRPRDIVAIYGHRSASLVWALLGVLKSGAAFVILDPAYPALRLIDCLSMVRPQGWLQLEAAGALPEALGEFVESLSCCCRLQLPSRTMAAKGSLLREYSIEDPRVAVGPDDLAYVAFTSGTTGQPKGILGTHGPLSHFLEWHSRTFDLNESDRFSLLSGLSHDPLLRDIFTPLWLGATLCIPDVEKLESPEHLANWIRQEEITAAHLTPAMSQLLSEAAINHDKDIDLTSLRSVFFGGDALTKRDVSGLQNLFPSATYVNFYGTTETPQAMGYYIVPNHRDTGYKDGSTSPKEVMPLGRGIEGVQLLVLNPSQQLAGVGELGEIHVRTPYLAKGYLADDELTQERFIMNPFTKVSADRLYRTGDLGRYLPDGEVEFAGRIDNQIKIRGFRIELGEIEAVLSQNPAVEQAVVLAREDGQTGPSNPLGTGKRLVAYVISKHEPPPAVSELRSLLKEKLPDHMVPAAFVFLNTLPLTPNGKVDRKALPEPDQSRPELKQTFVAPRTPVEEALTGIWSQLLGVETVGVHDDFFELGGHSLLATQVIFRVRKSFEVGISLRALFESPTVAGLAAQIVRVQARRVASEEMADVLSDLESLSDEEVEYLLAQKSSQEV